VTTIRSIPDIRLLKALADDNRLRILDHLRSGECCVCELMEELDIAQSLLSFHLKTLKDAGLITDRREGRWAYYALDRDALAALGAAVNGLADPVKRSPHRRACS